MELHLLAQKLSQSLSMIPAACVQSLGHIMESLLQELIAGSSPTVWR